MVLMRIVPRWILGGVVGAAAIALSGCSPGEAQSSNAPPAGGGRGGGQNAAVPVTVGKAIQKSMPITIQGIGTVIAASTVTVRAQITGEMTSVTFKEGEDVEKDQILVTLDKRPFEAALQLAQAQLEKDVAQAAALDATVAADRANVETAQIQLTYATIKAPMAGRTGLLQVHPGNLVRGQ